MRAGPVAGPFSDTLRRAMATTPIRIRCTLDNASASISGIRFGRVMRDGEVYAVSEPVDPDQAEALLAIQGFTKFTGTPELVEAIDEAIDAALEDERASAAGDGSAAHLETIEELQRANRAMANELAAVRAQGGDPTALAAKDGEIASLREAMAAKDAALGSLRADLERVTTLGKTAAEEVLNLKSRIDELEKANAELAKPSGPAAGSGGGAEERGRSSATKK